METVEYVIERRNGVKEIVNAERIKDLCLDGHDLTLTGEIIDGKIVKVPHSKAVAIQSAICTGGVQSGDMCIYKRSDGKINVDKDYKNHFNYGSILMETVEIAQDIENLKQKIEAGQQSEIIQLRSEKGRLASQIEGLQQRLEPLLEYEKISKQVDSWKEKELTVAIKSKEVTKNIYAFAHQYGYDPEFFVRIVLEGLFRTDTGRSTLGMIIAKTVESTGVEG